ncbi:hypothetical protein DSCA_38750 [Desulfosarcina alkanivorans]|uniref:HD/PDEase domain-containing protein n=1 Tax=Desulfosarcina alkanivorans TaxID=571177 RepID=A0A5K7YNI6_9BACT|nr:hypothetical protein [Desulfosarcina alkanivorans]BBO69945.1 hypothetical protein DSCA_38750 [Desulfosarcina alkanivorans]
MADVQLANLVQMESPQAVLDEGIKLVVQFLPGANPLAVRSAFNQTVSLYEGAWEETSGCNTDYHNLKHVTDCFLAMVRLFHGAVETGAEFSPRQIHQGMVAALLHDSGYLQSRDDTEGTGAKYTCCHVRRSMDFIQRHFAVFDLQESEIHACMAMIHCTDLNCDLADVPFPDPVTEQIGKMLATADILAQMADRTYLEKLLFLYYELDEARIDDYSDEVALLRQSEEFYDRMAARFETQLSSCNRLMVHHFKARWQIDEDLYQRAIDNQQAYLTQILTGKDGDPRDRLRRSRIVDAVKLKYA